MELYDCFWLTCVAGFWLIASQKKKVCGNYWKLWTSVIQRIFTSVCKPWGTATWVMSGDTVAGWGWANSLLWLSEVLAALQSPGERQEVWKCSLKVQCTSMSIGKDTTSFDFCLRFPLEYSILFSRYSHDAQHSSSCLLFFSIHLHMYHYINVVVISQKERTGSG